jgi:hypothetical protein
LLRVVRVVAALIMVAVAVLVAISQQVDLY